MTPDQIKLAIALGNVTFLPGHPHKRFARSMSRMALGYPFVPISEKQDAHMRSLAWRYRRQMPADLVPATKP